MFLATASPFFFCRAEMDMRSGKTSRLTSTLAILGLIIVSIVMVLVLNSGSLVNPTLPFQNSSPNNNPGPTGTLVVQLRTNQNESDRLSDPTAGVMPLGEKPMVVMSADNFSARYVQAMITNTKGDVLQELAPGNYVLRILDQTLVIRIPVQISLNNVTKVVVNISGKAYPLTYSEESGIVPVAGKAQAKMFVELRSSTPIADVNQAVLLKVRGGAAGVGYLANATVLARPTPVQGNEWLELGAETTINRVNATTIVLTTWSFSSSSSVTPIGIAGVSADA
jgi:hypothetical protein